MKNKNKKTKKMIAKELIEIKILWYRKLQQIKIEDQQEAKLKRRITINDTHFLNTFIYNLSLRTLSSLYYLLVDCFDLS